MRMSHGELSQLSRKGVNSQEVKFEQELVKFNRPREVVNKHAERKADQASFLECQDNIQGPLSLDHLKREERRETSKGIRGPTIWLRSY